MGHSRTCRRTTAGAPRDRGRRFWQGAVVAALTAFPSAASALSSNGMPVPAVKVGGDCQDNVQTCLDDAEGAHTVDALAAASEVPETYDPHCNMTFSLLARGGQYHNAFGWYNVARDPSSPAKTLKPADSELHTFLLASDAAPLVRALALSGNLAYRGGLIGFFLATGYPMATPDGPPSNYDNLFYSERAFNPDNGQADPSVHLIVWQSVTYKNSFYFGWEDLLSGNDNDFNDFFARVDGIGCAGGGQPCDTGHEGVCKDGTMECQQGALACVANSVPSPEKCNALDDDCNGKIDDGAGLCPDDQICDRGACVPPCSRGEFVCGAGLICSTHGTCVDPACNGVDCPLGQLCQQGKCNDACLGVTCPYAEVCRNGACVDPCKSITCDQGYSCQLGLCSNCSCKACESGLVCQNNACVDNACASVSCMPGTHCEKSKCTDNCQGVACPGGGSCTLGQCQAPKQSSGGVLDGGTVVLGPAVGATGSAGASAGAGNSDDDSGTNADIARGARTAPGCGCKTANETVRFTRVGSVAGWFCLALAFSSRLRRRSGRPRVELLK